MRAAAGRDSGQPHCSPAPDPRVDDGHAEAAARALARDLAAGTAPRSAGLRIKAMDGDTVPRAKATLERFVTAARERRICSLGRCCSPRG